jgi:hypothetical protein
VISYGNNRIQEFKRIFGQINFPFQQKGPIKSRFASGQEPPLLEEARHQEASPPGSHYALALQKSA